MSRCGRPVRRAVSRPVCADETNPALSVDRKLRGASTVGPHTAQPAPAAAPHDPPRQADACRSAIGRPILENCGVRISIDIQGRLDDVSDVVAGNLLLVIQEALTNAIRHGRPASAMISLQADDAAGTINATVTDDGRGFVPGTQRGMEQGHFGMVGMRERIERLGGSLSIESSPGKGTTVRAVVSRTALDAEPA